MKSILFTEQNTLATIKESKTNTRRLVKCPHNAFGGIEAVVKRGNSEIRCFRALDENWRAIKPGTDEEWELLPRYKVGDKVYIKEPYKVEGAFDLVFGIVRIYLQYSGVAINAVCKEGYDIHSWMIKRLQEQEKSKSGFCNKMFMPEWCARHFIEITDVKCERLQDISDSDCIAEGVESFTKDGTVVKWGMEHWEWANMKNTPQEAYKHIWESINGAGSWDLNPFVWSYHYKLVKQ